MKVCNTCNQEKELAEFYKRVESPDGYRNDCKSCRIAKTHKNYYANHSLSKQKHRDRHAKKVAENPNWYAEHYEANKKKLQKYSAVGYIKHREKRLLAVKEWVSNNVGKANANKKAYKVAKLQRTPKWVGSEELWLIQEAYDLAVQRTKLLGFSWHVDHIVPLQGALVSGLHTIGNLQVIPGVENMSKSNKFEL